MASKLVRTFVESLAKKVYMTPEQATSTYAQKAAKIVKEDPRFLKLYDEEDIGSAIYSSRTGEANLGVMAPEKFLELAAQMPTDKKGYEFIRETIDQKKSDIAEGIPRDRFAFPTLGMRLNPKDNSLFVNMHDGRHINTAMKEMGYPKGLVEIVPQYKTPNLKTMSPDTPVYSEESFIDDVEIPSKQVGTLGELVKFLGLGAVVAPGALSQLTDNQKGDKVAE
tara:strand:- start:4 stop:672 length:669 start_codon:yes stop_codon:yes gene_type:complete